MSEAIGAVLTENMWLRELLIIGAGLLIAVLVGALATRITERFFHFSRFTPDGRRMRPERMRTLQGLVANAITVLAFVGAILFAISRFVQPDTLVWVVGLFSAAFGLGARPLVNDFLAGLSFIFEDTFDVGEKVEMLGVEGIIERVTLRVTLLRAPTGELYVVPNGDIRVVRNFSRGRYSTVTVHLKVPANKLSQTLELLEEISQEAMLALPNLLEPWQILSETGALGESTELTLLSKARFGHAAEMRPRLLAFIQGRLAEQDIQLAD
ncbi:MAG TPA: mechanosensitive ion channel domain-containing protein [Candidatus Sulfomarinibacteraceae bacterium]|nr:mechanosensitive ion channel domain-containing protein [Candidatus Sulfomarinibacteraceae bacterium]